MADSFEDDDFNVLIESPKEKKNTQKNLLNDFNRVNKNKDDDFDESVQDDFNDSELQFTQQRKS